MTWNATKPLKLKNLVTAKRQKRIQNALKTAKLVGKLEFEKTITSQTNLLRTRKIRNKFSVLKRKFTPLVRIYIPDVQKLNKNLGRQHSFEGSHLSHFIKAMDDGAFEAKQGENLKMKPACEGLNWYFGVFDCEK